MRLFYVHFTFIRLKRTSNLHIFHDYLHVYDQLRINYVKLGFKDSWIPLTLELWSFSDENLQFVVALHWQMHLKIDCRIAEPSTILFWSCLIFTRRMPEIVGILDRAAACFLSAVMRPATFTDFHGIVEFFDVLDFGVPVCIAIKKKLWQLWQL